MNNLNVKTGDTVVVITGKDKGKKGKVLESFPKTGRILVEGTKSYKKNKKPRSAQDTGGIINITGTTDVSNVMIVCSKCGKPTRVGHAFDTNGKKFRICKNKDCGASLEKARVKEDKKKKAKEETVKEEKAAKKVTAKDTDKNVNEKEVKAVKEPASKPVKKESATVKKPSAAEETVKKETNK